MCKRQEKMDEVCPCSTIVGNLGVKTDESKKEEILLPIGVPEPHIFLIPFKRYCHTLRLMFQMEIEHTI